MLGVALATFSSSVGALILALSAMYIVLAHLLN
jgi:hypothetical protein